LERSGEAVFPVIIIIYAIWIATLVLPCVGLLFAWVLKGYRSDFGPRSQRWLRVLTWISAVYAVGFSIWASVDVLNLAAAHRSHP